ncbi:MAG: cupredoxin domain-containing protein [Actinomycetota bacterium]
MRRMMAVTWCALTLLTSCGGDGGSQTVATPPADAGYVDQTTQPTEQGSGLQAVECENRRSGPQALIEIADFRFEPNCVEMTTSQGFELKNNGEALHNFSIEGVSGIDVDVAAGQENNTESPGLDADTYTFFCKYHRGQGMEGELRVSSG